MQANNFLPYEKLTYKKYQEIIKTLTENPQLIALGLKKTTKAFTKYGYPIDCLTIGFGQKELFLVGGTHGSEIISVDFLLNLINNLPNENNFNPNELKLTILPLQNPEGFDISTNTLKEIPKETFKQLSYEFYLKYRTDSITTMAIKELNQLILNSPKTTTAKEYLHNLKKLINENKAWLNLSEAKALPNIKIINTLLNQLQQPENFTELKNNILSILKKSLTQIDPNNQHDNYLAFFITQIKNGLKKYQSGSLIKNEDELKLYQQMFKNIDFFGLYNPSLEKDITNIYQELKHPLGSQIGHDANGLGINLNANSPTNQGIDAIKNNLTIYGPTVKNNLKNYCKGPLGLPTENVDHFTFTIENQVLEKLIKESIAKNQYLATLLYHATGGMIFYKPYEPLMTKTQYQQFYQYNETLASIYANATDYTLLPNSDSSGYGDYLRRTYPGVLLIELSKMGGNPIGPYGSKNNQYLTIQNNNEAFHQLLKYFEKPIGKKLQKETR